MPQVDLFGDNNVPNSTEVYDKRIGKIQAEIHNYLRQGLVPGAVQQVIDKLDNISIDADSVNLNTDQLEAKLDTLNGLTTTIQSDVALIKGDVENINGHVNPNGTLAFNSVVVQAAIAGTIFNHKNNRKYLLIQNLSTNYVFVSFGSTASASSGIRLAPSQGIVFEGRFVPTQYVSLYSAYTSQVVGLEG